MKAIIIKETGDSDKLLFEEIARPVLEEGQVCIKVHAAPINFIDIIIRRGDMPPKMMPELPFIPGVEATGTIEDANGLAFQKGQKVAFLGLVGSSAYAEYMAVDASKIIVLPDRIDLEAAAVVPVNYFTAYHMMYNVCRVESGKIALVYAASGGVGTALIQLLKYAGLQIVALERRAEKMETALKIGADHAFNTSDPDWIEQVESKIGKDAINYVFNPVAGDSIKNDLRLLARLGHIVIFGFLAGADGSDIQKEAFANFGKAPSISFSEIYASYNAKFEMVRTAFEVLFNMLNKGYIQPIYETMPLAKAKEAHNKLEQGLVRGKLLLVNS